MVCTTIIISAVSRKETPRAIEKTTETTSSSARIARRILSRHTKPTANPNMASVMAAYPIPMSRLRGVNVGVSAGTAQLHQWISENGQGQRFFTIAKRSYCGGAFVDRPARQERITYFSGSESTAKSSHNLKPVSYTHLTLPTTERV